MHKSNKTAPALNPQRAANRRKLLKSAGIAAGAAVFGRSMAWGDLIKSGRSAMDSPNWPQQFQPNSLTPHAFPREMPKPGDRIKVFDVEVVNGVHEILPGIKVPMFLYNGTYPGPEFRVTEGDWVQVNLKNKSFEFHTIHWHGIQTPCEMDGVPLATQWPVGPDQEFRYLFRAQPAGTHFYHCHYMTTLHVQAGLVGAFIIESASDPVQDTFSCAREYTLILSECDTNFVNEMMNEMAVMGKQMNAMMHSSQMMKEMSGKMMGWFADKESFLKAIKEGYIPPYTQAATGIVEPITPNFFMINGKSYPMTDPLMIKMGENIRVRLIGGGMQPHFIHLHGHDFWHVCQDGSPLASPVRMNTIPVFPGTTSDIVIEGNNPGNWHFHDHSDLALSNNGQTPGGMMTMLMYEDAAKYGYDFKETIAVSS